MDAAIAKVIINAEKAHPPMEGDYIGEDGLRYCGKCHTVKQKRVDLPGMPKNYIVDADCKCEAAQNAQKRRRQQLESLVIDLQEYAFDEPAMKNLTFENAKGEQPELMEGMRKYVHELLSKPFEECTGLILSGDVGRGKSYAAAAVVNVLIKRGIRCRMTNFSTIEEDLRDKQINVREYRERLNHCKLLVLDDLNAERSTSYMEEFV